MFLTGNIKVQVNLPHLPNRGVNINTVALGIVFCKYCSHRIESPYHSINHQLQKSEAFQSVHHVTFILCYTVLSLVTCRGSEVSFEECAFCIKGSYLRSKVVFCCYLCW